MGCVIVFLIGAVVGYFADFWYKRALAWVKARVHL
jgi:hypothetical protein